MSTKPSKQIPAHAVAELAAEALTGDLTMSLSKGMALVKVFEQYKAAPTAQADAVEHFATLLARNAPMLAARLVDSLGAKVGR